MKRHRTVERFQLVYSREITEIQFYFNDKQTSVKELSKLNQKLLEKLNQVIEDI